MQVSDYTALLSSWNWGQLGSTAPTVVTYALNSAVESHWYTFNPTAVIDSFESAASVEGTIRNAFNIWEKAGNIQFVMVDGDDADINIGLFDFSLDPSTADYAGYAFYPDATAGPNSIAGDILIDAAYKGETGLWLHEIGHAMGLDHPHEGDLTLAPNLDNTTQTVMSYNGGWKQNIGPLDRQAAAEMYKGTINHNMVISEYEMEALPTYQAFQQIRDYDGNKLGAAGYWEQLGVADVQLDGDDEFIYVNRQLGRWATVGPDDEGLVDFGDHGAGGETRVVGIYLDPNVESGKVQRGSALDSAVRFGNDLRNDNLELIGSGDFNNDGYQNLYFKTVDSGIYLNALMHDDGNIRYANYQNEAQMINYLTSNGYDTSTYDDWLIA